MRTRYKAAMSNRELHMDALRQQTDTLPTHISTQWIAQLKAWESDSTQFNPFEITRNSKIIRTSRV